MYKRIPSLPPRATCLLIKSRKWFGGMCSIFTLQKFIHQSKCENWPHKKCTFNDLYFLIFACTFILKSKLD